MAGISFLKRLFGGADAPPRIRLTHAQCEELVSQFDKNQQFRCRVQAVQAIMPFWVRAIEKCAELTEQPDGVAKEMTAHAVAVPAWCRKWRNGEPIDRSELREFWKSTTFVSNAVLRENLRDLAVAPVIRNMHSIVTGLIKTATEERYPPNLFGLAYDIAFVRERFPLVSGDLMRYSTELDLNGVNQWDRVPLIYAHAARELQKVNSMQAVFDDALVAAEQMGDVPTLSPSDFNWELRSDPQWYQLRRIHSRQQRSRTLPEA